MTPLTALRKMPSSSTHSGRLSKQFKVLPGNIIVHVHRIKPSWQPAPQIITKSALWPSIADLSFGPEQYSGKMPYPCGLAGPAGPYLDGVVSGLLCVMSSGSPFWCVACDKSASNSAKFATVGVLKSDPEASSFSALSVLRDSLGVAYAFSPMALVHIVMMKLRGLDLIRQCMWHRKHHADSYILRCHSISFRYDHI